MEAAEKCLPAQIDKLKIELEALQKAEESARTSRSMVLVKNAPGVIVKSQIVDAEFVEETPKPTKTKKPEVNFVIVDKTEQESNPSKPEPGLIKVGHTKEYQEKPKSQAMVLASNSAQNIVKQGTNSLAKVENTSGAIVKVKPPIVIDGVLEENDGKGLIVREQAIIDAEIVEENKSKRPVGLLPPVKVTETGDSQPDDGKTVESTPLPPNPIDNAGNKVKDTIKTLEKIELVVIDVEEKLKRIAERLADERLDQEMKEIGPQGWKQLWRVDKIAAKWWKRNANEGYRQRYTAEILARLRTEPKYRAELMNLNTAGVPGARNEVKPGYMAKLSGRTPVAGSEFSLNNELDAIAERFGIAWNERSAGGDGYLTTNENLTQSNATIEVQSAVRDICQAYVNNTISEDEFRRDVRERVMPLIKATGPANQELVAFLQEKSGGNIPLEQRRGLLDKLNAHKAGLIRLDLDNFRLSLAMGKAQNVDVKTQVKDLGTIDRVSRRFIESLQNNRFLGRFLSPTTIGVMGYGMANIGAQLATNNVIRTAALFSLGAMAPSFAPAIAGVAVGCLVGSAMGYFRKNKETLHLKAQKERRSALNHVREDDQKGLHGPGDSFERRMENGEMLYQKKNASELMANINSATTPAALSDALADAICRNNISEMGLSATNTVRMDLISFDGERSMEKQRLDLMIAIARGRFNLATECARRNVDPAAMMANSVTTANANLEAGINTRDASFRKFKRWENIKAAGMGAAIGASFSGLSALISYHHTPDVSKVVPVGPGKFTDTHTLFDNIKTLKPISGATISDAELQSHLVPDANGHVDVAWLKTNYGVDVTDQISKSIAYVPGTPHMVDMAVNQDQAHLLTILQGRGVDTSKLHFVNGVLDKDSNDYLHSMKIDVTGNATSVTVPGPGALSESALNTDGFTTAHRIHFNANDPTGRVHTLDELRFYWKGKPELGADGYYHFHAAGVNNPNIAHSNLPSGVNIPGNANQMQVGMQVNHGGKYYWKMFTPVNGELKIPKEYFDEHSVGPIARGGSQLPGLRTNAIAFGFKDQNGTFQILSSASGTGKFVPGPTITNSFSYNVKVEEVGTDISEISNVSYDVTMPEVIKGDISGFIIPPIYMDRMKHLEYGDRETGAQVANDPKVAPVKGGPNTQTVNGNNKGSQQVNIAPSAPNLSDEDKANIKKFEDYKKGLIDAGEISADAADTEALFDFNKESKRYFDRMKNQQPGYFQTINSISQKLQLNPKAKAYVAMPCAVDEPNLERNLASFAGQTNKDFEIVLFMNAGPMAADKAESDKLYNENLIKRTAEIQRVQAKYPNLKIHSFNAKFGKKSTKAAVRAILTESILMAAGRVGNTDPLIISTDANNLDVSKSYVDGFTSKFEQNPGLDYCLGQVEWDADYRKVDSLSKQCPELLIGQRMMQVADAVTRSKDKMASGRVQNSAANSAIRGKTYLAVGGYDRAANHAENAELSNRIKFLRFDPKAQDSLVKNHVAYSSGSSIQASPKGALSAIVNGLTVAEQSNEDVHLGEADLAKAYKDKSELIQVDDIKLASMGDVDLEDKILNRTEMIFKKLLMAYNITDAARIGDFLNRMSLKTTTEPSTWTFKVDKDNKITDIVGLKLDPAKMDLKYLYRYNNLVK